MYPKVKLVIKNLSKEQSLMLLEKREIDFMINLSPIENFGEKLTISDLKNLPHVFFASKKFVKTNLQSNKITKADLEKLPTITHLNNSSTMKMLRKALDKTKLNNNKEVASSELVLGFVLKNKGIGYAIEQLVNNNTDIIKLDCDFELPKAKLCVAINNDETSKPVLAFIDGLKEFCKKC